MIARLLLATVPPAWFGTLIPTANAPVHYTDLTWQDLINPAGTVYTIYKAPVRCADATSAQFVRIAANISSGPAGLAYRDYAVVAGQSVCYYVTAGDGMQESAPSPKADAITPTVLKPQSMERQAQ